MTVKCVHTSRYQQQQVASNSNNKRVSNNHSMVIDFGDQQDMNRFRVKTALAMITIVVMIIVDHGAIIGFIAMVVVSIPLSSSSPLSFSS